MVAYLQHKQSMIDFFPFVSNILSIIKDDGKKKKENVVWLELKKLKKRK